MRRLLKTLLNAIALLLLLVLAVVFWLWPRDPFLPAVQPDFSVERFSGNPVVHSGLSASLSASASEGGYVNINNPSVIRVPDWIENPLGTYYLYFSHHKGDHIRLAYAGSATGPWTLYEPGTLWLADSGFPQTLSDGADNEGLKQLRSNFSPQVIRDYLMLSYRATVADPDIRRQRGIASAANAQAHIASPEIIVDQERQRLVMYYHGLENGGFQRSRIAVSPNGIDFEVLDETVFSNYLRAFSYRSEHFVLGMPGILYRSERLDGGFVPRDTSLFEPDMRHAAVWVEGETLHVLWSRVGGAPEGLLYSRVDMSSPDWNDWQATRGVEIMRPAVNWEGSELPILPSLRGEISDASHELRDPFYFRDADGSAYLYYVGAGEQAIGVARIVVP